MTTTKTKPGLRMSDESVQAKTGKNWKEWFAILNKAGGAKMSHQEIVKLLNSKHGVGPWWCQMVAVTYEQQHGLRDPHQKPNGYEISVSRTINAPVADLYVAFNDEKRREKWLGESGLQLRTAQANKSLRIMWKDGKTSLAIAFLPKSEDKCQVVIQHSKLPSATAASRMKTYWANALERLRDSVD